LVICFRLAGGSDLAILPRGLTIARNFRSLEVPFYVARASKAHNFAPRTDLHLILARQASITHRTDAVFEVVIETLDIQVTFHAELL
jgi:hypothetical protein